MEQDANKDARDVNGQTPLNFSASRGHIEVSRCLIEEGADKQETKRVTHHKILPTGGFFHCFFFQMKILKMINRQCSHV